MGTDGSDWLLPGAVKDRQTITPQWRPFEQTLIEGVVVREMRPMMTGIGHLTEVLREEWLGDRREIGQVFVNSMLPGGVSAWHAHAVSTDRLFPGIGLLRIVLFDARKDSPTFGLINDFKVGPQRPALIIVPPLIWHGVQNYGDCTALLINAVDRAYRYEDPDHWRIPEDSAHVPFRFPRLR